MQGAQKLRGEAHLQARRNDEVAAQRRRWTFYETIKKNYKECRDHYQINSVQPVRFFICHSSRKSENICLFKREEFPSLEKRE